MEDTVLGDDRIQEDQCASQYVAEDIEEDQSDVIAPFLAPQGTKNTKTEEVL